MKGNCLLILPALANAENRVRQTETIDILKLAIKQADLTMLEEAPDGLIVNDITPELIRYMEEVEFVVMDLDSYDNTGEFSYSPVLFYLLALRHTSTTRSSAILTASSTDGLPNSLRAYVITYSKASPMPLITAFQERVKKLQTGTLSPSDPVQAYRRQQEFERLRREQEMTQVELEKLKREQAKARAQQSSQRIQFRKVDD